MINKVLNIVLLAAASTLMLACSLDEPTLGSAEGLSSIQFSADASPVTKAGDDVSDFEGAGHKMIVFDHFTGTDWSADYINGVEIVSPQNPGIWSYTNNGKYYWLEGTHEFYGYYSYDGVNNVGLNNLFRRTSLEYSDGIVKVPETTFTRTTSQFDFMYSEKVVRENITIDSPEKDTSPVNLINKHLFAGISISVRNKLNSTVKLEKLSLENFKNKGSASIDFRNGTVATTTSVDNTYKFSVNFDNSIILQPSEKTENNNYVVDVFAPAVTTYSENQEKTYYLTWPHDVTGGNIEYDVDGVPSYGKAEVIYLEYSIDGGETLKRAVKLPATKLEAGNRYQYTLTFSEKGIDLKIAIHPWTEINHDMNYGDNTITAGAVLTVNAETCNNDDANSSRVVDIKSTGAPAAFSFRLLAPTSGTWFVTLSGDYDKFKVTPSSGSLLADTPVNFSVEPIDKAAPDTPISVQLKLSIRMPDGTMASLDEAVQKRDVESTEMSKFTIRFSKY